MGTNEKSTRCSSRSSSPSVNVANHAFVHFYSAKNSQFQAPTKSDGTLGREEQFGYFVWPQVPLISCKSKHSYSSSPLSSVAIEVHSLADAALAGSDPNKIPLAISVLQRHWNPGKHGFCAWHMYEGNNDIYYDDNAHAANALITAYQATQNPVYLAQANEILTGLILPGWNKVDQNGVPWHTSDPSSRNACSTGSAAVAALRLSSLSNINTTELAQFGEKALNWLTITLQDPSDDLISDNIKYQPDGSSKVESTKWTYNTGFAIHGFTLLHQTTRNEYYLNKAIQLAKAATKKSGALYDHSILEPEKRMYADGSFFLHHLLDGFSILSNHALQSTLRSEIACVAAFGKKFMYDPTDGLYFRGSEPYSISQELTDKYNLEYGTNKSFEPNASERDDEGHLCKTLIGCAGWVRIGLMAEKIE
ncbi:hypothetical protein MMC12_006231 [Toensbergia leucococca]|nr:hypothetical protein [Toensbergia leucococca]